MQRIFHPVGQGAFYSEHFDNHFTIVYDCGSNTLTAEERKRKVRASLKEGQVIDLLFISHFHQDHINGLDFIRDHCQIKRVVIPFLDDKAKLLIQLANRIDGYSNELLINDPESFFGNNTEIIRILPITEDNNLVGNGEPFPNEPVYDEILIPASTPGTNAIPSGSVIRMGRKHWFFVPFNFKNDLKLKAFEAALKSEGIKLEGLSLNDAIFTYRTELIKAYRKVDGDINQNSLVVYSGKDNSHEVLERGHADIYHPFYKFNHLEAGCLYTGDADLNEQGQVRYLENSLRRFSAFVGTVQIPHHGAIKNHNREFYMLFPNLDSLVCSYGTTNTYGHPSDLVIAESSRYQRSFHLITENRNTLIIQNLIPAL